MRFPFFRNRDSVKNGILISIRRTGDGFHPGLFRSSIIVQFTDAIVGIFENSDAVAEGFAYARYYHQTGIDSEWETNPLVKLGEKLMQEHAMLDFHKIVLDTASRERLLKR